MYHCSINCFKINIENEEFVYFIKVYTVHILFCEIKFTVLLMNSLHLGLSALQIASLYKVYAFTVRPPGKNLGENKHKKHRWILKACMGCIKTRCGMMYILQCQTIFLWCSAPSSEMTEIPTSKNCGSKTWM